MSLLDAFLEDQMLASELKQIVPADSPPQVPRLAEIWLALRTDGDSVDSAQPFGDGSCENPYAVNTVHRESLILST